MKNNIVYILLLILLIMTNQIMAQNVKVLYSLHFDKPEKKFLKFLTPKAVKQLTAKKYFYLQTNDTSSIFYPVQKGQVFKDIDSTVVVSKKKQSITKHTYINEVTVDNRVIDTFFINYVKKYYISNQNIGETIFNIRDSLPELKWQILDSIKIFKNFTIHKATTSYRNSRIVAWFTEDIPVGIGPRIFQGLPGLIMKLKIQQANYEVEKVQFYKKPLPLKMPDAVPNYISEDQYYRIMNQNKYQSKIIEKKCATCPDGL